MMTKRANGIVLLGFMVLFSCSSNQEKAKDDTVWNNEDAALTGKQLSMKYCQSCHLYPEPSTLDKTTWERSILPLMGRLFGIYEENVPRSQVIEGAIDRSAAQALFPPQPTIDKETWQKITDYYLSLSPESLAVIKNTSVEDLSGFELIVPSFGKEPISTTLVRIDAENSNIYVGGMRRNLGVLTILNQKFEVIDDIKLPTAPTDIEVGEDRLGLSLIGTLRLKPSNNSIGELVYLLRNSGEIKYTSYIKFLNGLRRPLQIIREDLNGDGFDDMLIAEYGYYTGSLTLYENSKNNDGQYRRRIVKNVPGAIKLEVRDMNNDGHKDIIALFAQGDESISIFYNDGKGGFVEDQVLRFSPAHGSVYFELADMNNDGFLDILYCNGDNGDYPPILKGYHGVHIYENDGDNNFKSVYFYPMHGVYKSSAADFNQNGHLDIVAISYFPDFSSHPRNDFVLLKGEGNYSFVPQYLKEDIPARWITLDVGDLNGDGYKDILLGASGKYPYPLLSSGSSTAGSDLPSIVYLKNLGKN